MAWRKQTVVERRDQRSQKDTQNKVGAVARSELRTPGRFGRTWKHLLKVTSSDVTSQNLAEAVSLSEEPQGKAQSTLTS